MNLKDEHQQKKKVLFYLNLHENITDRPQQILKKDSQEKYIPAEVPYENHFLHQTNDA
jgi:hypothetical protein